MQKSAPRRHNACSIRIQQLLGVGALDGFATTAGAWRRLLVERNLDSSCALFL
jgi:hypothetical protein